VAEELGVQYVLEGSVQKSGDRVRITAQLIDATQGHHLWSKRYDRDMQEFFALQDEITKEIVVALQVELTDGEQARLWHKSTNDLETWGQLVRAGRLFERFSHEDNAKARELLEQVLEKEPENAFAWTLFAWTHLVDSWLGLSGSGAESIQQAIAAAKKAEELDVTRPEVHSLWSTIHLLQGDFERALVEGEKSVALGPSNSLSHILFANVTLHAGEFDRAIAFGERAIRLTPYCPYWFLAILAESYRQAGRYSEAEATYAKALERAREDKGNPLPAMIGLVDVLVELGREDEARDYASQLLRANPDFSLEGFRKVYAYEDPVYVERMALNLRQAGLPATTPLRMPDKPSVAVLPFVNMSGDPEQEYFSDGLTEDLITDLSRIPGAFVISRNSVFRYKGQAIKPEQVSEELGVRYLLEGSVRKVDDRVRITAQLIDATTGGHLWAERYDRSLTDVFAVQDEITQQIVAAMKVNVTKAELERAMRKDAGDLSAYEYTLRGRWHAHRHTKEANEKARLLFEKAIELDPNRASAYAGLGWTYYKDWAMQWSPDPQSLERAFELARRAVALDDFSAGAHILLGHVYLWKKQHDLAIQEKERAIALDPNDADGYADLGETLLWVGRPEEAIELLQKAMRLNPHEPALSRELPIQSGFCLSLDRAVRAGDCGAEAGPQPQPRLPGQSPRTSRLVP
jgi:TolB-like protein/lipopolysaccharide biosynthesis regulator YciM